MGELDDKLRVKSRSLVLEDEEDEEDDLDRGRKVSTTPFKRATGSRSRLFLNTKWSQL